MRRLARDRRNPSSTIRRDPSFQILIATGSAEVSSNGNAETIQGVFHIGNGQPAENVQVLKCSICAANEWNNLDGTAWLLGRCVERSSTV